MGNENKYEPRPDAEEKHFNEFLPPKPSGCKLTKGKCVVIFLIGLVIVAGIASIATVFVIKAYQDADKRRVEFIVEMTLLEDWSAKLADLHSQEFKQKVADIETEMDTVFKNGKLSGVYESAKVRQLRKGSVIVYMIVVLNVPKVDLEVEDGSVLIVLEDSDSPVDAISLIKQGVASANLRVDTDNVSVRASGMTVPRLTTLTSMRFTTQLTTATASESASTTLRTTTMSTVPTTIARQTTATSTPPVTTIRRKTTVPTPVTTTRQTTTTSTSPATTGRQTTTGSTTTTRLTTTTSTEPFTTTRQTTRTTTNEPTTTTRQTTSTSTGPVITTRPTTTPTAPSTTTLRTTTTSADLSTTTRPETTTTNDPTTSPQQTATTSNGTTTSTEPSTTTRQTTTTITNEPTTTTRQTTTTSTGPVKTTRQTTTTIEPSSKTLQTTTTSTTTRRETSTTNEPTTSTQQTITISTGKTTTTRQTTTTTTRPATTARQTTTTSRGRLRLSTVHGTVTSSQPWSESLRDRTSEEYNQMEALFESEVSSVVNKTNLKEKFMSVNITDTRPGSVIIDFALTLKDLEISLENDKSGTVTPKMILSIIQQAALNTSSDFNWTSALIGACSRGQKHCPKLSQDEEIVCILQESECEDSHTDFGSPNCTFEEGSCGYADVRPFRFNDKSPWKRVKVEEGLQNLLLPLNDHTTGSYEGHVMVTEVAVDAWSNLASPEFTPNQRESCLTFHWFTMCRNIQSVLRVYASANDDTRLLREMHLFNYRQDSRYTVNGSRFIQVDVTLPPLTNRIFFQFRSDARRTATNSIFREALDAAVAVSLDDVSVKPGECLREPVSCSFPEAGLFGYQQLFLAHTWFTDFTDASNPADKDRHLIFSTFYEEAGYIASPVAEWANAQACLSFDYKFDGAFMASLSVHVVADILPEKITEFVSDRVWSLSSSGHLIWRSVKIPLSQSETKFYRVVLEGRGKRGSGDLIRVDNIVLQENPCPLAVCAEKEFRCQSTLTCIPQAAVCNSVRDCSDADLSDEQNKECASLESVTCNFDPKNPYFCGYTNASDGGNWAAKAPPTPVRLMNYDVPAELAGRVEVFTDGEWGALCSLMFGEEEASVICRMLGYNKSSTDASGGFRYGLSQVKKSFALDCDGDEDDIADCDRRPLGVVPCDYNSIAAVTCSKPIPRDGNNDGGLVSHFTEKEQFGAVADLASPLLECLGGPGSCGSACVSVDFQMNSAKQSPVFIFGEDSDGKKLRLWASHNWKPSTEVVLSNLTGVKRLHFVSYYNNNDHRPLVLKGVTYKQNCDQTNSVPETDDEMLCDGIVDFESGIDEWGQQCAGNLSVNCTFEDGHACGYAGVIRSSPWKLGGFPEMAEDVQGQDLFFHIPWYDHAASFQGTVLYFLPSSCADISSVNELRFPQIPELSLGGCLHFYFSNTGNFTLTSPEGHLFHSPELYSNVWRAVKVQLPVGLQSLSLIADCTATFVVIDDVTLSPGACTSGTTTRYCPERERFLCSDGREISCRRTCTRDFVDECGDGSAQNGCVCQETSSFRCGGPESEGHCVSSAQWCDGHEDCDGGYDEMPGCGCLEDKSFTCTSSGMATCKLFYEFCSTSVPTCEEEKGCCKDCCDPRVSFVCNNGKCINRYDVCNYHNTCGDYSDEMNCTCLGTDLVCPRSGVCVQPRHVCDGYIHCPDGEDESEQCVTCDKDTEFQCNSGLCIKKHEVCDGYSRCTDREDEVNCSYCSTLTCRETGYCVLDFSVCDGIFDCFSNSVRDISDEANCECAPGNIRCNNSLCVPDYKWCDRVNDCLDGSDEKNCRACPSGDWRCTNGQCIRLAFRCDGYVDCRDSSDEHNCLTCQNGTVLSCGDAVCLHPDRVCDGIADCPDKTDEMHCGYIQPIGSMSGAVYFNRTKVSYPVCGDIFSTDTEFLDDLCHYLFRGSYLSHGRLIVDPPSNVTFLSVRNGSAGEDLTSRFTLGMCVGNSQLSISCRSPSCGKRQGFSRPASQIVGGETSLLSEWPWMGYLYFLGKHRCGVSVINENWVLTAAHCVTFRGLVLEKRYLSVTVGSIRTTSLQNTGQSRGVSRLIHHEDISFIPGMDTPRNDIALLKLSQPLDLRTSTVKPICLPRQGERIHTNSLCYAAGWGLSIPDKGSSILLDLNHIRIPIVDSESCAKDWQNSFSLDRKICAGFRVGNGGSCHGDSGGPLMCQDKLGFWSVEGIVSFGTLLCSEDPELGRVRPHVYARVADYRQWIDDVIRENT